MNTGQTMRLLHYSRSIVERYKPTVTQEVGYKPKGFWVSVEGEDDWKSWCEAQGFRVDSLSVVCEVKLHPDANILHLQSAKELHYFTSKYMAELYPGQGNNPSHCGINWRAAAQDYQGIIIAPYIWKCRMNLIWYYGWDCASGCIWGDTSVQSIIPRTEEYFTKNPIIPWEEA